MRHFFCGFVQRLLSNEVMDLAEDEHVRADLKLVRAMEDFVIKNTIFAGDYAFHLIKNLQNTIETRWAV